MNLIILLDSFPSFLNSVQTHLHLDEEHQNRIESPRAHPEKDIPLQSDWLFVGTTSEAFEP